MGGKDQVGANRVLPPPSPVLDQQSNVIRLLSDGSTVADDSPFVKINLNALLPPILVHLNLETGKCFREVRCFRKLWVLDARVVRLYDLCVCVSDVV